MSKLSEHVAELEAALVRVEDRAARVESDATANRNQDLQAAAWMQLANHPFFSECYDADDTLLAAMLRKLDDAARRADMTGATR